MPINPITGEEEGYDVSGYYDEEDAGPFVDTSGSFPVDQPVISRAINPQPLQVGSGPEFRVPVDRPGGLLGAASKEYLSGRPGLFIQGGPTVPAGTIEVNGQLERSQAAPQGLPWWIREADQFKEQRRQEDEALRLARAFQSSDTTDGNKAMAKARQLQGRLQLQADIKAGVPFPEAYARSADKLYGDTAPRAVADLVRAARQSRPIPTGPITGQPVIIDGRVVGYAAPLGRGGELRTIQEPKSTEPTQVQKERIALSKATAYRAAASSASESGDVKAAREYNRKANEVLDSIGQNQPVDKTKQETILLNKKTGKRQIFPGKLDPKEVDSARFDMLGYK